MDSIGFCGIVLQDPGGKAGFIRWVYCPGDGIAGAAIGYGVKRDVITASKGGDRAKKGGTVRNRCGGLTGQSLEYGVSDERASREDGAVSRR